MKSAENILFEFPHSSIKNVPLKSPLEEKLSLAFIEIGCRPAAKRKQLKDKRELFYNYWNEVYLKNGVEWLPEVYRILVHYGPGETPGMGMENSEVNLSVIYHYITPEMLEGITEQEKSRLYKVAGKGHIRRMLEEIVDEGDAVRLHALISGSGKRGHT